MGALRRILFYIGLILIATTLILITLTQLKLDSYLLIAFMRGITLPFYFGLASCALALIFVNQNGFFRNVAVKVIAFVTFVVMLYLISSFSVTEYVSDIRAVINDELDVFEASVKETRIDTKTLKEEDRHGNKKQRITQWILLDNAQEDEFKVNLWKADMPKFEEGKTYKFILLPNSKHLLDHEEM